MSSIMRARSGLTGRFEDWEVIGGSSLKPKVAGPSMLGIGCPNRHAFLFTRSPTPPENPPTSTPPSRESGFVPWPDPADPRCRLWGHEETAAGLKPSVCLRGRSLPLVKVGLRGETDSLPRCRWL